MKALEGVRGVLFDLDGTLVDTRADIAAAANATLRAVGEAEQPAEVIATYVGDGGRQLLARTFALELHDPRIEELFPIFLEHYVAHAYREAQWISGAREVLAALEGVPVGLVTNKHRRVTEALLGLVDLPRPFDLVVAGGDGALKPDPWSMHHASAQLGIPCTELVLVGDGPQDVGAARAAGVKSVAYTGGFHPAEAVRALPADLVVEHMGELLPWARSLALRFRA
jgi:2-phosphoglycolate phosphatase